MGRFKENDLIKMQVSLNKAKIILSTQATTTGNFMLV
jgi:hypothetical protein